MRDMPTKLSDCHADTFSMCSQSCVNAGLLKDTHPHTHTDTPTPVWYLWWWHQSKGNANFRLEPQTIRPKADLDILTRVAKVCEGVCVFVCVSVCVCVFGCVWAPVKPLSCVCLKCSLQSMCSNFIWALAHPSLFIYDSPQQQLPRLTPNRTDSNKNRPQSARGKTSKKKINAMYT